jgi:tight adherence protein B
MAQALGALSGAIRDLDATHREITAALAGPRATMRLIVSLPFVAALGGLLSGGPGLAVLASAPGFVLVALGVVMIAGALWWLRLLEDGASPDDGFMSLELDLFQIATSGGLLPERALALVTQVVADFNLPVAPGATMEDLTALSRRAGVPVGALAGASAAVRRERTRIDAHEKVQKLGVHVVLPLGLLVLPAFVLIAVAPMALGLWHGGFA